MKIEVPNLSFDTITIVTPNLEQISFNVQEEARIGQFNVREEFYSQPAKYAYWGELLSQAKYMEEAKALDVKRAEGLAFEQARTEIIKETSNSKPTQAQIEARMAINPILYQLKSELLLAQKTTKDIQELVKAFEHRRDMLIQIGADMRKSQEYDRKMNMGTI